MNQTMRHDDTVEEITHTAPKNVISHHIVGMERLRIHDLITIQPEVPEDVVSKNSSRKDDLRVGGPGQGREANDHGTG